MSGSNNVGGKGAGITSVASAAVLPFTGGYPLATAVLAAIMVCGGIVLLSIAIRSLLTR